MSELLEKQLLGKSKELLPFFNDDSITDILINGTESLFIEKAGALICEKNPFTNKESIQDLIERLLLPTGRRVDVFQPYLDGALVDGSRFHLMLPPLVSPGPMISIRKFRKEVLRLADFGKDSFLSVLKEGVVEKKNILIAGGTGAGKTSLLSCLLQEVSPIERILVLEESKELQINHPHVAYLESRLPTAEGKGGVNLRNLLKNSLRMRPDRIVVGEVRGGEAFDLLMAMNTGHKGCLGTLHASSAMDALKRLESLVILAGYPIPLKTIREWVGSNIQMVVYLEKGEGKREIKEILNINGLEGEVYRIKSRLRS